MTNHMTEVNRDRLLSLPVWARELIDALVRERDAAMDRAEDARLATKPDESNTLIDPYGDPPIGLGVNTLVRFRVGSDEMHDYIDVYVRDDRVLLQGGAPLRLAPHSSNLVTIKVAR